LPDEVDPIHSELATSVEGFNTPIAIVCFPLPTTVSREPERHSPDNVTGVPHNNRTGDDWTQDMASRARFRRVA
jgi:hypothetical protein